MYPTLPFGPLSLPTGPIALLVATLIGLEIAGRYGRRLHLTVDDVWNCGLLALFAGLIVARVWNVITLWPVYRDEPWLILSIRPSGFVLLPGVFAAVIAGYLYLLRRALDPVRIAAAYAVGAVAAGIVLSASAYLTGSVLGTRTDVPWALPYFGELRHPVALYQALGLWVLFVWLWLGSKRERPGQTVLLAGLGYSLLRLLTDAFTDNVAQIGSFRVSQVIALVAALILSLLLARSDKPTGIPPTDEATTEVPTP
jgi:phosphatidylglycerol---prolipoprotein diacylglyceryl transferase